MKLFVWTYDSHLHCEVSKRNSILGFHSENSGVLADLERIRENTLVLLRDSSEKSRLTFFGLFRATGRIDEVDITAERIWTDEVQCDQVIYNLRLPVEFICSIEKSLSKSEVVNLQWKRRKYPYHQYAWQGYSRLFAGNFLEPDQIQLLLGILGIEQDASCVR